MIGLETSLDIMLYGVDLGMYLVTPTQARPEYSPLPFENKLYFQENLSKYLREKYPQLNVSAMKVSLLFCKVTVHYTAGRVVHGDLIFNVRIKNMIHYIIILQLL